VKKGAGNIPPHLNPLPRGERKIKDRDLYRGRKGDFFTGH